MQMCCDFWRRRNTEKTESMLSSTPPHITYVDHLKAHQFLRRRIFGKVAPTRTEEEDRPARRIGMGQ